MKLHLPSVRRKRFLAVCVVCAVLAFSAVGYAVKLPAGSFRVVPNTRNASSHIMVNASFAQPAGAELKGYNVYLARGFRFDPRAVAGRCTVAQARHGSCPPDSKLGGGIGQVTVSAPSLPATEFTLNTTFYLTPPQRRGDIAGLVLAGSQPGSTLTFDLLGRLLKVAHGAYGLVLQFAHTESELPSGLIVQLHHVRVHFGTQRTVFVRRGGKTMRTTYRLLTNPGSCTRRGWPFLLTVTYSAGVERYLGDAACAGRTR